MSKKNKHGGSSIKRPTEVEAFRNISRQARVEKVSLGKYLRLCRRRARRAIRHQARFIKRVRLVHVVRE